MSKIIRFTNNDYFSFNGLKDEGFVKYIREQYGVNPEKQIKITKDKVFLTGKFGETIAQIAEII